MNEPFFYRKLTNIGPNAEAKVVVGNKWERKTPKLTLPDKVNY